MLGSCDTIERAESLLTGRERIVVPEMSQAGEDLITRELRKPRIDHGRD